MNDSQGGEGGKAKMSLWMDEWSYMTINERLLCSK